MNERDGMRRDSTPTPRPDIYERVPVRRPRPVAFSEASGAHAGAEAATGTETGVGVLGVEVCQSVQAFDNSVPVIAMKPTLVRVYLDDATVAAPVRLRGELCWRKSKNGPKTYLAATNELRLDPAAPLAIADKRDDLRRSLNFRLPEAALQAGALYLTLNRLIQTGGGDIPFHGETAAQVEMLTAPPIRVRCIGLRYTDPDTDVTHTPNAVHCSYFRSFLQRAYPVSNVIWSQIVVDADFAPPFGGATAILANAQIAAIRNSEINAGTDPRTHYYGLVDDANGRHFMRGRASGIPAGPQPDTVASGPCGAPDGFAGDTDLSYADWYGAHELGHTFGRFHPGFPPGSQDASDPTFPYENGQISDADRKYVGYDPGDPALSLPERILPGTRHHDVMTYAERQWVSAYTFDAIRLRLAEEDEQFAPLIA